MIELISIIASLAVAILTPIEVRKIRNGWIRPKFTGDRSKFLTAYRKQLVLLTCVGVVFGLLELGLASIEDEPGESIVKVIAGIIWLAVAGICFVSRRMLPSASEQSSSSATDSEQHLAG